MHCVLGDDAHRVVLIVPPFGPVFVCVYFIFWFTGTLSTDPIEAVECGADAARWGYNATNRTLAVMRPSPGSSGHGGVGSCVDLNGGEGPDIDLWPCHGRANGDFTHQQWWFDETANTLATGGHGAGKRCLTLARDFPAPKGTPDMWVPRNFQRRLEQMLRLLKSAGVSDFWPDFFPWPF